MIVNTSKQITHNVKLFLYNFQCVMKHQPQWKYKQNSKQGQETTRHVSCLHFC